MAAVFQLNGESVVGENAESCDRLLQHCGEIVTMKVVTIAACADESFGMKSVADFPGTSPYNKVLLFVTDLHFLRFVFHGGHRFYDNYIQ
jgi:hypothetical protein